MRSARATAEVRSRGVVQALERAAARPRARHHRKRPSPRPFAFERELAGAEQRPGRERAQGSARASARAAGGGADEAGMPDSARRGAAGMRRVREALREHALVVQAADTRVQNLRVVGPESRAAPSAGLAPLRLRRRAGGVLRVGTRQTSARRPMRIPLVLLSEL